MTEDLITRIVALATLLVAVAGPLALGLQGWRRAPPAHPRPLPRWDWTLSLRSALLYTLAFNLTFFLQEFFLVLPKSLTPGLHPTLFHNNHAWTGDNPLAALFQGTGVVATMAASLLCRAWLARRPPASANARLFLLWMAYCGMLMALPQFAIGALSDVGMAMSYLGLAPSVRLGAGLLALAAIPPFALGLLRPLLALADAPASIADGRARTRFVFLAATLPVLLGALLSVAFRVPRQWIEVVLPPAWVAVLGVAWMQAGAWRLTGVEARGAKPGSPWLPIAAVLALLLVFQCVLRPGIAFP